MAGYAVGLYEGVDRGFKATNEVRVFMRRRVSSKGKRNKGNASGKVV